MKNDKAISNFRFPIRFDALTRLIKDHLQGKYFSICLSPNRNFIVKRANILFLANIVDNDEVYTHCEDTYTFFL